MTNRASTLILLAFATISTGCGGDRAVGPLSDPPLRDPPVLTSVELSPASVVMFPGFTQQLALAAFDQHRSNLPAQSHAVTYSSSDPAVATVSNSGQITALSAGTAEIAATLTVDGATQKGVMTTTVTNYPEASVWYELTAPITSFDPGWGDLTGYTYTVVLQLPPGLQLTGTYTNLRLLRPNGEPEPEFRERSGIVTSGIDFEGRLVFKLLGSNGAGCEWIGILSSAQPGRDGFEGTFGAGCHISGTFTARRIGN